jgi:hypothetical protein
MNTLTRRQLLQCLAGGITSAGAVVLARSVLAGNKEVPTKTPAGPDERADRLAEILPPAPEDTERMAFVNRAFRNGGGFRNGGFANGGGFRNGGFANGGFRNGGFRNGSFRNW